MKSKYFIVIYYALLLLVFVSRKDAETEPSLILRLVFLLAVVAPCFINKTLSYPAVIMLFFPLTVYGFAYSYMPYSLTVYLVITIACAIYYYSNKGRNKAPFPSFLIVFAVYIFLVDTITGIGRVSSLFQPNLLCYILIMLMLSISDNNNKDTAKQMSICLAVMSITLSYSFLTNREMYVFASYDSGQLERTGWTDPNYFGMALGMGTISSLIQLFQINLKKTALFDYIVYIIAIVVSFPVLILNASRGALLSVTVAFIVLILLSKTKNGYKGLLVLSSIVFIYYLYTNQYFDLLLYRIANDDGTGSSRTLIWLSKLKSYVDGGFLNLLFGYGFYGGLNLGGKMEGFHNDFIAFLVCYGVIGLSMLLYMLYYPIKLVYRMNRKRAYIVVLVIYLSVCFLTLEPFLSGFFAYFLFYCYIIITARSFIEVEREGAIC